MRTPSVIAYLAMVCVVVLGAVTVLTDKVPDVLATLALMAVGAAAGAHVPTAADQEPAAPSDDGPAGRHLA